MGPIAAARADPGFRRAADDLAEPLAALRALIASAQQDVDRTSRICSGLEQMQAQVREMADLCARVGRSQFGGASVVLAPPLPGERAIGLPSGDDRNSSPSKIPPSATGHRALAVVICDDHRMFAESLGSVLEARGHDVVACTAKPDVAVAEVAARRPDILVTDLSFPNADGVDALVAARQASPATRTIVLSGADSQALFLQAKLAGAAGCLGKHGEMSRILDAVEAVAAGDHVFEPPAERFVRGNGAGHERLRFLTERERQVLERLVQGQRTVTIAAELGMADSTTRSHIKRVLSKLGAHSRLEAVSLATAWRCQDPTDHRKVPIRNTPNGGGEGLAAL